VLQSTNAASEGYIMRVAFAGSVKGMSPGQRAAFTTWLTSPQQEVIEFGCGGADPEPTPEPSAA
jgi:hypothetical protein